MLRVKSRRSPGPRAVFQLSVVEQLADGGADRPRHPELDVQHRLAHLWGCAAGPLKETVVKRLVDCAPDFA